jgi:type I restriction enzyme S subunit
MALRKIKLGELLEQSVNKNNELLYSLEDVRGISIKKIFIETKADMEGVSLKPYLIVKPDEFAYVTVTSRNGEKITLAYNNTQTTYIVSSSYVVFRVKRKDLLNSTYLFMYFNRPEFDRYSRYNSWGSAREVFTWQEMCDIEIELPDLETQEKFVNVYQAMCENQKAYERGLDDLKLVCDAYIEDLRKKGNLEYIGKYTSKRNEKNVDNLKKVLGISKTGFIKPKTRASESLQNYNVFYKDDFVFSPPRINIGSIGLYRDNKPAVCSPIYEVFFVDKPKELIPEYLYLWVKREEFFRYTDFMSIASVRNNFDYEMLSEIEIPVPSLKVQQSIVDILEVYETRKDINEKLKQQIKEICPILIKGSLEA